LGDFDPDYRKKLGDFDPDYREKWAILTQITGKNGLF
jgi:hypothetical protein